MALPTLSSVQPTTGPSSGGDLVRLVGTDFADRVRVLFGGVAAEAPSVRDEAGLRLVDLRTPVHAPGVVGVELQNLDAAGVPVPGESVVLVGAYRFARPTVAREADLTRVVRQLLRELKRQVLANVSATVSVDYDDTTLDGLNLIAMAKVPSLVLSGPTLRPNRFYSANVAHEDVVDGIAGPELARRKPPYTVDLVFTLTAASERTAELFNLMAVVATFLNRNRWLELQRDPADASRGSVRWELDADGEFRTQLAGKDDVRAFTCG
ncbi:MAG: IPT/TIG domain-containing protein, partial [Myxococcales bacterium]|nr:IPT/TIG domain-containing protein [Myxococcales bacterium]